LSKILPYGRQSIDETDIAAVTEVLKSEWLTTGPMIENFEKAVAGFSGAAHAVAISNGTSALHAAMNCLDIGPGDEVIVPAMTFVATANSVVYQGGTPVFADVKPGTLLADPGSIESLVTKKTKAISVVDYAGQPCDYAEIVKIADKHGLRLVSDACHALGGSYQGRKVGTLADLTTFSFHPVKHITTGEGGMILTDDEALAGKMRRFRNHGISTDHRQREKNGTFYYEMEELGFNYRLSDIHAALGISQLRKLPGWIKRRQEIAALYDAAFAKENFLKPLKAESDRSHAYHLYVVQLDSAVTGADRGEIFKRLRESGIGVNVHYLPVHLHAFYRNRFGTKAGLCPVAEAAYERMLSLPMFPTMTNADVDHVVSTLKKVCAR
jgi:perosamine synthetase